jgi:hypothetical protein
LAGGDGGVDVVVEVVAAGEEGAGVGRVLTHFDSK